MKNIMRFNLKLILREKVYYLTYIVLIIVFIFFSKIFNTELRADALLTYLTLIGAIYSISTIKEYENNKQSSMKKEILSLTITRKDYVLSKYILYILFTIVFIIINYILINTVSLIINKTSAGLSPIPIKISIYYNIMIGVLYLLAIVLSKGNLSNALIGGIIGFSVNYISYLYNNMPKRLLNINKTLLISIIFYVISFSICYFVFNKKDMN